MKKGLVSNIQHFSIHDGPGIRTTVFLKGCSMKCLWCSNPEMIDNKPELMFSKDLCLQCSRCVDTCQYNALKIDNNSKIIFNKNSCMNCGLCEKNCPSKALTLNGKWMTVDDVMSEINKDSIFYQSSSGGVTLSGGEPFMQSGFLKELVMACNRENIHTAVETAGNYDWKAAKDVIDYIDLFLYDIKLIDSDKHLEATGVLNTQIMKNLKNIIDLNKDVIIRVPLIPNYSATVENLNQIGTYANFIGINKVHLLPYHEFGKAKYEKINKAYLLNDIEALEDEQVENFVNILNQYGLNVLVGGGE